MPFSRLIDTGLNMKRLVLSLLVVSGLLVTTSLHAQLPINELHRVVPNGAKQGTELEVTVGGAFNDDLSRMVFNHAGITAQQKMTPAGEFDAAPTPVNSTFLVKIAADVPAGTYEARIVGRYGVSNSRPFQISTGEEIRDNGANRSLDTAQEVAVGSVVTGTNEASNIDYYKVHLTAGQRVIADCWAHRLDSKANVSLVLFDAGGTQIAVSHDHNGYDPLLDFTAVTEADYTIGVYDFVYGGGGDHSYRLHVSSNPVVDYVIPSAGAAGSNGTYTIVGRNLPGGKPLEGVTLNGAQLQSIQANIQIPAADGVSGLGVQKLVTSRIARSAVSVAGVPVIMSVSELPTVVESGDNNEAATATKISVPVNVSGQFYPARDVDWYEFEATQGSVFWIDVVSHQLGLPTDPSILIQRVTKNDAGEETVSVVASVDDPGDRNGRIGQDYDDSTDDPSYKFTSPADAVYRIRVLDNFGVSRSDPRMQYELRIRPEEPGVRLTAELRQVKTANANEIKLFSPVLRKSGTLLVNVRVERLEGYAGDIRVKAEGLPAGVTCQEVVIGPNQTVGNLIFVASADVEPWDGAIELVGSIELDGQAVPVPVNYGAVSWGTANKTQIPAYYRTINDFWLSVIDVDNDPAFVTVGDGSVLETSRGGSLDVPVKIARGEGIEGDLKFIATNVPGEIKPADITIKAAENEQTLAVKLTNANAKPGLYTFYLKADGKVKRAPNPAVVTRAQARVDHVAKLQEAANADVEAKTKARDEAGEDAKAAAEEALKVAQDKKKRTDDAKAAADKALADAQKAQAVKDVNVAVVSTPITLNIVNSPFTVKEVTGAVKAGEKIQVKVVIERKYGFVDPVDLTIKLPGGVAGVTAAKLQIAKDATEGMLEVSAAANATVGEHAVELNGAGKFNNVPVTGQSTLKLNVAAAAAAQ